MKSIFKKPQVYWFFGIFVFYIILNILISGFYDTIPLIIIYAKTVDWFKLGLSLVLTVLIGALVAANSVKVYMAYKQRKECSTEKVLTGIGTAGGLIVGVCPLCVVGIFPIILGAIGISFSFGALPFGGIEVQVLVLGILVWSYFMLEKRVI